jgi:acyl-CoA reductase-like NAD-dependent aldehyde dehydrogenase
MADVVKRDKLYIDGAWVAPSGNESIDVINATTEEVMGTIPQSTPDDVDKAVNAARKAFDSWSTTSVEDRAKFLQRIHEGLNARSDEIATTVSQENGMPLGISKLAQAMLPIMNMAGFSQVAADYPFTETVGTSEVIKEPVGVVACITPWNYPLHQVVLKVAPALAAGCTIVLKPSELAPLTAWILAEVINDVGLPAGVFNLVSGTGAVVGEALVSHPEVDMISFTGSTRAGRRISELASPSIKRVALELGGKSPNIILDDADLESAVKAGISGAYLNSGQTCTALTRMLVPKDKLADAERIAKEVAETFTPGDPFDGNTRLGPLVSAQQQEKVRGFIKKGIDEGAKLVTGGAEQPEGLEKGFFIKPTVFSNVSNDMTIAREEIFGPVLSIIPYEDEEDAVRIANDTIYGLAAAVFSGDKEHAKAVARRIRAGQVQINEGGFNPNAPFGGYKQSGKGREAGKYGLEEFLEIKALLT